MKLSLFLISIVFSAAAYASRPIYLGNVGGVLMSGVAERETFAFYPGLIQTCTRKDMGADFSSFECDVTGAGGTVTSAQGNVVMLSVRRLHVFYKGTTRGWREYHFTGVYSEQGASPATGTFTSVLYYYVQDPANILGFVSLDRGGSSSVRATQELIGNIGK